MLGDCATCARMSSGAVTLEESIFEVTVVVTVFCATPIPTASAVFVAVPPLAAANAPAAPNAAAKVRPVSSLAVTVD